MNQRLKLGGIMAGIKIYGVCGGGKQEDGLKGVNGLEIFDCLVS